ncbi:nudix hydrolase homolog 8 isoform X1 [Carex rostrata]
MERLSLELKSEIRILEKRRLRKLRGHGKCFTSFNCSLSSQWKAKASYKIATSSTGNVDSSNFLRVEPSKINGSNGAMSNWNLPKNNNYSILDSFEDEYGGIVINADRLPRDPETFSYALPMSLSYWKLFRKKGVWLKLPLELSDLVPIAVKQGFKYHHAEQAYVMLTYWIPEGPCMLPANASHQVGVGGFVINDQNQVLVVQEKYCDSALLGAWKLPTGFIQESEEIFSGAVREVKEETGIDTEFVEVIAFRHAHHLAFEKSDLFFICMLRPLSHEIKIDEMEIQAAKWMPFGEFVEQPLIQEDGMFKKIMEICIQRLRKSYCGLTAHPVVSKFDGRWSSLYYHVGSNNQDFNCHAS